MKGRHPEGVGRFAAAAAAMGGGQRPGIGSTHGGSGRCARLATAGDEPLRAGRFVWCTRRGNHVGEPRVDLDRRGTGTAAAHGSEHRRRVRTSSSRRERSRHARRHLRASLRGDHGADIRAGAVRARRVAGNRVRASPCHPDCWTLATIGVAAAFRREVEVSTGGGRRGGERITIGRAILARTSAHQRRCHHARAGGGIWSVDAFTEREAVQGRRVAHGASSRGPGVSLAATSSHTSGEGVERWDGCRQALVTSQTGLRLQTGGERLDGRIDLSGWKGTLSFGMIDAGGVARSTTERRGLVLVGRGGFAWRPRSRRLTPVHRRHWRARPVPARAHTRPFRMGSYEWSRSADRSYASGEVQRWWMGARGFAGAAAFIDTASSIADCRRCTDRRRPRIGTRLTVPGVSGVLRIDVAKRLRDGATAVSFVYEPRTRTTAHGTLLIGWPCARSH